MSTAATRKTTRAPFAFLCGLLIAACGSTGSSSDAATSTSVGSASLTPQITATTAATASPTLTTGDLRAIPGLPTDVRVAAIDTTKIFENPDPRGPCGAKIPQPSFKNAAGVAISGTGLVGDQLVTELPSGQAAAYVRAMIQDGHTPCPQYTSTTNTGATQIVTPLGAVEVHATELGLVYAGTIQLGATRSYAVGVLLVAGDKLQTMDLLSPQPIDTTAVNLVVQRAAQLLNQPR